MIMEIALAVILLLGIYVLWKLFIDGWLYKMILFPGGWLGIYLGLRIYVGGAMKTALTLGSGPDAITLSYAATIASVILFLALLTTKVSVNNE